MMTSSNGNISALLAFCVWNSPVTGEFPAQRPMTRSFDVFFDLRLIKTNMFNILKQRQNGRRFPDYFFKVIFFYENYWISIQISLKYIPIGPINKNSSIVLDGLAPNGWQAIIWTNDG